LGLYDAAISWVQPCSFGGIAGSFLDFATVFGKENLQAELRVYRLEGL